MIAVGIEDAVDNRLDFAEDSADMDVGALLRRLPHVHVECYLKLICGTSKSDANTLRRMVSRTTRMQSSSTGNTMTRCSRDVRESCIKTY